MIPKKGKTKRILLVDNSETTRKILRENLEKEGYAVIEAEDGQEGLDRANEDHPDLIISDVYMPVMNGFEFCQRVRDTSNIPSVPLIFFTTVDDMLTEVRGFRAGANDYLVKIHTKRQAFLLKIDHLLSSTSEFEKQKSSLKDGIIGKLSEINILDVLELLHHGKKTGTLMVSDDDNHGYIYFLDGRIFNASFHDLNGEEAVYEIVTQNKGFFKFEQGDISRNEVIPAPTNKILNKCRRLLGVDN